MFHHSALVCVFEITLLASILIPVPAVYLVSVAEIVFQSAAIWILFQAINVSCFQFNAFVITLFSTGFVLVVDRDESTAQLLPEFFSKSQLVPS
jgi:hypothetical protein